MWTPSARRLAQPVLRTVARALARLGVGPNALTVFGVVLHVPVVWCLAAFDTTWAAGVALALAGAFDALDGAVARETDRTSRFGAFLDSVVDRVSESLVCFGLVLHAQRTGDVTLVRWAIAFFAGSILVSYTRARAAGIGVRTQAGWFGRLERTLAIGAGLLTGFLVPVVVAATFGAWATALSRVVDVWQQAGDAEGAGARIAPNRSSVEDRERGAAEGKPDTANERAAEVQA
ncbi:MAG: CDP-alcohol phosphatidyltransferase family protein [Ardenticatenales bacterium]|nr:CDP-alcohol phosphatidyltransferase family protein [Ardenticatenales bacterium]